MSTRVYGYQYSTNETILYPDLDKSRFFITENELYGLYEYIGPGIVDGWDVISWNNSSEKDNTLFIEKELKYLVQNDIDLLSSSQKKSMLNLNYKMVIKITLGDGIIDHYAAFTTSDYYYGFANSTVSKKWYVYTIPTPSLPESQKHYADIYITSQSDYDSNYIATYLATVNIYYDRVSGENYISSIINENHRRKNLYKFKDIGSGDIIKEFLSHVHDGKDVSKIKLNTLNIVDIQDGVPKSSPIFIIDKISLFQSLTLGPTIVSVDISESGGLLEIGNWYYQVTFIVSNSGTGTVESLPGNIATAVVTNNKVKLKWEKIIGAIYYNIYRTENANDSSTRLYLLKSNIIDYEFIDDGSNNVITPLISTPQDTTSISSSGQSSIENINSTFTSPNDSIYIIDKNNLISTLSYNIPGIFQSDNSIGFTNIKTIKPQTFYKVNVKLNNNILDVDDYKIITQESGEISGIPLLTGLIELKNNIKSEDILDVVEYINPLDTQVTDKIRNNRIDSINADNFKYGQFSKRYITAPNHFGMLRIKENTYLLPYCDMRTSDYLKYTVQNPNSLVQYDDEIFYIGDCINTLNSFGIPSFILNINNIDYNSYIYGNKVSSSSLKLVNKYDDIVFNTDTVIQQISGIGKYILSTRSGNYITQDFQYFDKLLIIDSDIGLVIDCIDNLVFGRDFASLDGLENKFYETYILLDTGKIFYSIDNCISWTEIIYPSQEFFATAFSISTSKSQKTVGDPDAGYLYGRRLYIGGYTKDLPSRSGVWSALLTSDESISDTIWQMMDVWKSKQNQTNIIYSICEIITYSSQSIDTSVKEFWQSNLYVSSNNGLYLNNTKIINPIYSDIIIKKIIWLADTVQSIKNNLLLISDTALYTTKDAKFIQESNSSGDKEYWKVPFSTNIGRFYKIADNINLNSNTFYSADVNNKYYILGTNNAIWYGKENIYNNENIYSDIFFNIKVINNFSTNSLLFNINVINNYSNSSLFFNISVYSQNYVDNIINLSDLEYSHYFGWNLPNWIKSKNSDIITNCNSLKKIGYIRNYNSNGPAPLDGVIGRTGPLSGLTIPEEEDQNYIKFDFNVDSNNKIKFIFESEINISGVVNNSTLEIISGSGLFNKFTKILWINTKSYVLYNSLSSSGIVNGVLFENISVDNSQIPTDQITSSGISSQSKDVNSMSTNIDVGALSGSSNSDIIFNSSSIIAGTKNGLWLSEYTDGTIFLRVYNFISLNIIPSIYINDNIIDESNYIVNYFDQSILFNSSLKLYDKVIIEKDFKEYFLVNGKFDSNISKIIVYIDNIPTNMNFSILSYKGMIRLSQSIDRKSIVNVSIVINDTFLNLANSDEVQLKSYLPHIEIESSYIISQTIFTYLSEDIKNNSTAVRVITTKDFPNNVKFIKIDDEILSISMRNNSSFFIESPILSNHYKGSSVYLVTIGSILGIEDRLSMQTSSGITYNFHNIFIDNLMNMTSFIKSIYTDIIGQSNQILPGYINEEGFKNSLFYDFNNDNYDNLNSFTTYRSGLNYDISNPPKDSLQVFCSYNFGQSDALIGTDTGIWKLLNNKWILVSSCGNCSRIYFIKKFRGDIWSGTDNGVWASSDDGNSWNKNSLYYQNVFDIFSSTIRWKSFREQFDQIVIANDELDSNNNLITSAKYYEVFMKQDGTCFVLYAGNSNGTGDFNSDHIISLDDTDVYFLSEFEGRITIASTNTEPAKILKNKMIIIGGEAGIYILKNARTIINNSPHPYSNFISEMNMISNENINFTSNKKDANQNNIIENIKVFDVVMNPVLPYYSSLDFNNSNGYNFINKIQDGDYGNLYIILLTNDGIKISDNFIWSNFDNGEKLNFIIEPLKGMGYICYSHISLPDSNANYQDQTFRYFVRLFVGTNKGVIYSIDGGFTWLPTSKFPNFDNITVYNFEYFDNILYAFTNRGIYYTQNMGVNWFISSDIILSDYEFLNHSLAQVFVPEYNQLTKISVWLKKKYIVDNLEEQYEYTSSIYLKIYDTNIDGGPGNNLIYTSPTIINSNDVNEPRWCNFICDFVVDTTKKYSIVIEESGYSDTFLGWAYSKENYSEKSYLYNISWIENLFNFIFLVHYDKPNDIKIEEFNVVYNQLNANNLAITSLNDIILDLRYVFSFVIDGTGSMSRQDPNGYRKELTFDFINKLLNRNKYSYIDIWSFDSELNEITSGLTRDINFIDSVISSILSEGNDSEIWSGSSIGLSNSYYTSIVDKIKLDEDFDYVIYFMDSMKRINYDYLKSIDLRYDGTPQQLLDEKFINLRNIVIDDYVATFARVGFILTDGFDNASSENWRSPVFAMDGIKNDKQCPLYFFGIGLNNNQTSMIASSEEAGGKFYQIADNYSKLEDAYNNLLNGDHYIWSGMYEDYIDLGENSLYVLWIECPAVLPQGYNESDLLKFEIRYTKDFSYWSPWTEIQFNIKNYLNVFVNYIEYKITIKQGDNVPGDFTYDYEYEYIDYGYYGSETGDYPSPIVGTIKYAIIHPSENIYILNPVLSDQSIFEYVLNYNSINSNLSTIDLKIGRGNIFNQYNYVNSLIDVKQVLPIRERTISYSDSLPFVYVLTDLYSSEPTRKRTIFAVLSGSNRITWSILDEIDIYLGSQLLDPNVYHYMKVPNYGIIEFLSKVQGTEDLTIKITKKAYVFSKLGEETIKVNNTTFLAKNGAWASDAKIIIYRNNNPILSGYFVIPEQGKIIFDDYVLDNEDIKIFIQNSSIYRLCVVENNYSEVETNLENISWMWSTIDKFSDSEILDVVEKPIVSDLKLKIDNFNNKINIDINGNYVGDMYSIPYISYKYSHKYNFPEQGTEIKWYRKRKNEISFSEISLYSNLLSKNIYDEIEKYNPNNSSIWQPTSLWTEGDTWKVSVIPKTTNSVGDIIYSNEIVIGIYDNISGIISYKSSYPIVIYDLKIYKNDFNLSPLGIFIASEHLDVVDTDGYSYYSVPSDASSLRLKFQYIDQNDMNISLVLDNIIVKWYKKDHSSEIYNSQNGTIVISNGQHDKWAVPNILSGESWYCELVSFNGVVYGKSVYTLRIEMA